MGPEPPSACRGPCPASTLSPLWPVCTQHRHLESRPTSTCSQSGEVLCNMQGTTDIVRCPEEDFRVSMELAALITDLSDSAH